MRFCSCGLLVVAVMGMAGCGTTRPGTGRGIEAGVVAPDFELVDAHGGSVRLSEATGKGAVMIVFYLGFSCPRCVSHLRSIDDRLEEFTKLGVQVVAISPDTVAETRDSVKTYSEDFSFPLLSDTDMKVARAYGMMFDATTMLHGVVVIGKDGRVKFVGRSSHPYEDVDGLLVTVKRALGT